MGRFPGIILRASCSQSLTHIEVLTKSLRLAFWSSLLFLGCCYFGVNNYVPASGRGNLTERDRMGDGREKCRKGREEERERMRTRERGGEG